ncbi:hypothetical protein CMEL01_10565 [Colletotrichum melonis]|uniref:Uncharacterized protein n=2 Tax=Colletotrichum acutatum species complex TaxID=2707335 RepID=A0AAI9TV09_9PEZI|nr:hypothetical protein CMEL01_10565 [Colletotrichum melonis]
MRRGGIEPPAPRRCWMATENFTTKPSTRLEFFQLEVVLKASFTNFVSQF